MILYTMNSIVLPTLIFVLATISVLPLLISIKYRRFDFFEPINFFSYFMIITVYSFIYRIYFTDRALRYQSQISWSFEQGMTIILVLFILFYSSTIIGYYLKVPYDMIYRVSISKKFGNVRFRLGKYSLVYILIGAVFYILLVDDALRGNPLLLFTTSEPRSEVFIEAYHLRLGAQMLHIGYFLWIVSTVSKGKSPGILQLTLFIPVVSLFLLLGSRSSALSLVVVLAVFLYYVWIENLIPTKRKYFKLPNDRLHKAFKLVIIPVVGTFILVFSASIRYLRRGWTIERTFSEVNITRIPTLNYMDQFDNLLLLLEYSPEEIGFYFGSYYIRSLLNFIPRAFWDSKPPLSMAAELRETVFPDRTGGLPPGTIGELYVNFGYPTIIVGGLILGMFYRISYNMLRKSSSSPLFLYIYSYILVTFVPGSLFSNNSLFNVFSYLLLLSPILILHLLHKTKLIQDRV